MEFINRLIVLISKQVDAARKWPRFDKLEQSIILALSKDRNLELEEAYIQAVIEHFSSKNAKLRGKLFVHLFAAAKQLVDNHPKRFPYLEQAVKEIEENKLAPPLERSNYEAC